MRRSKSFLSLPADPRSSASIRGKSFPAPNPDSPCLRASVVRSLAWGYHGVVFALAFGLLLALPAAAQTPAPQLSADLAHSPGWVVISVDDYQNLRTRAFPAERDPEPPPVDATLTRVDYDLRIAGELATGRASLTVDVLKDGWVRVPIP
jgi:hypothetical protein